MKYSKGDQMLYKYLEMNYSKHFAKRMMKMRYAKGFLFYELSGFHQLIEKKHLNFHSTFSK